VFAGCQFAWVEHLVVAYRYHQNQMTREADRMRTAIFTVIEKFFSQSDLAENILEYKSHVLAAGLIHAAAYAYNADEPQKGQCDLAQALNLDPALKENSYQCLLQSLVAWSHDPRSIEPVIFLRRIIINPPAGHPQLKRQLQRAIPDLLLEPLFSSSRELRQKNRMVLLQIIRYKPEWLLNKGVLRILADAWMPV
jgi:hypothetical protein